MPEQSQARSSESEPVIPEPPVPLSALPKQTVRRKRFLVTVIFVEDGKGDDFGACISDGLGSEHCWFNYEEVEDVVLLPEAEWRKV